MRWTHPTPPKKGDTRTVTRFLWSPFTVGYETRWLERATWTEEARLFRGRFGLEHWDWDRVAWVSP
jgi:hypothetical protein